MKHRVALVRYAKQPFMFHAILSESRNRLFHQPTTGNRKLKVIALVVLLLHLIKEYGAISDLPGDG